MGARFGTPLTDTVDRNAIGLGTITEVRIPYTSLERDIRHRSYLLASKLLHFPRMPSKAHVFQPAFSTSFHSAAREQVSGMPCPISHLGFGDSVRRNVREGSNFGMPSDTVDKPSDVANQRSLRDC